MAAEQVGVTIEEAPRLLNESKQWLQALLSEDAELIHRLGRQILRRSSISVTMLADQPEKHDETADTAESEAALAPSEAIEASPTTRKRLSRSIQQLAKRRLRKRSRWLPLMKVPT